MPVVHDYADGSGIYLNSNIDGSFITLQATPAAESFLTNLGYTDGETVSWQLIKPLWEQNHIYTGGSGTTVEATDVTESKIDSSSLSQTEQDELKAFLTSGSGSSGREVPEDIHGLLKGWSPNNDYSTEQTAEYLNKATDRRGAIKSVRHFGPHHPINVEEARMSGSGNPVYSFSTGDREWTATDLRWVDHEYDWVFTICPGDGFTQLLNVSTEAIEWDIVDDGNLREMDVRDTLLVYPDVVWFCNETPGYHPETSSWDLAANTPHGLPDEFRPAVEAVSTAATMDRQKGATEGVVLSFDEDVGYGRLQTIEYQTIPFSAEEYTDPDDEFDLQEQLAVSLRVRDHRGTQYAFDIEPTEYGGGHLFIDGLPQVGKNASDPKNSARGGKIELPDDIHEIVVDWCDNADALYSIKEQIREVAQHQALWESIRDFESCTRISVNGVSITSSGMPQYQIGFKQQGNKDIWEVTDDISEGPVDIDIAIHPSQAPLQEARIADGLVEYWRLAPLSEEPDSPVEYRNNPRVRSHRYNLYRGQSVRLLKGLVRGLDTVSLAGTANDEKYHIDSFSDPFGNGENE